MKVTLEQVLAVIGSRVETRTTSGRYGTTHLFRVGNENASGWLVGDPCYFIKGSEMDAIREQCIAQEPDAYSGKHRGWVEVAIGDARMFFVSCGDGMGPLDCCVDTGWVVVVPEHAIDASHFYASPTLPED